MKPKIEELGLGDRVLSKFYGLGKVIECTEKPSGKIKYATEVRTYEGLPEDLETFP